MNTEENKRMLALACTVADMKTENMYLAQRVQELVDEYNNVANQLVVKQKRKNKDSSKPMHDEMQQTLDELEQMREQCDHLKRTNKELEQRVKQLADENYEMACQLNDEEAPSEQTLSELEQMREHCDHLKRTNKELERFAKAMHVFMKDKNLFIEKDKKCPYHPGGIPVCSTPCLECSSCLGVLEGHGVICGQRLKEVNVSFPDNE